MKQVLQQIKTTIPFTFTIYVEDEYKDSLPKIGQKRLRQALLKTLRTLSPPGDLATINGRMSRAMHQVVKLRIRDVELLKEFKKNVLIVGHVNTDL